MTPIKRLRYFSNQLLTAEDFNDEQTYHQHKQRLRNLLIHGYGVISGLKVSMAPGRGSILVTPGIAIDPAGNEIIVPDNQILALPVGLRCAILTVRYTETPTDPVPALGGQDDKVEASRIEEGFSFEYVPDENAAIDAAVLIAKLRFRCGTWVVQRSCPCRWVRLGAVVLCFALLSRLFASGPGDNE
ncbi:MAG: hypothetical protein QOH88_1988 [Verrucomicrobiota bacterium]|jgi:hypothetical protein